MVRLAHESHRRMVATQKMQKEKVCFPGLDQQVEDMVMKCHLCQITDMPLKPEPLCTSDLPKAVWITLAADFYGPLDTSGYLLVVIDEYSCFSIGRQVSSTSATAMKQILDYIFAVWGTPLTLMTDNGPSFSGE
ncbi:hypothetical protein NDU88_001879 [Pleurodeles waltl]|uniref:Gypsy retrotransposon integrase-like protein 1 n=1 Tax=Pleurodeles waltl TaxID=8319 RepID=A0AAV7TJK9_PLEWA|nr:hypothetical protein NDU88_001879 [Pleurodeles waltl]